MQVFGTIRLLLKEVEIVFFFLIFAPNQALCAIFSAFWHLLVFMLLSSFILCRLESCCTSRTCPPSMYSLCLWREWIYTPMESSMSCWVFSTEWLQEILIIKSHPFSDSSPAMDRHLVFVSHSYITDWSNRGWQKTVHEHVFRHSMAVLSQYICVGVRTPSTLGGMTHYSARS